MKQKTLVTLLLDRSGSMERIASQTIDAINAWMDELRREEQMLFSLVQFDAFHEIAAEPVQNKPRGPSSAPLPGMPSTTVDLRSVLPSFPNPQTGGQWPPAGLQPQVSMHLEKTFEAVPVSDLPVLTRDHFTPRGSTPLIDAAIATIHAIEETVAGREDIRVVLAIQTDGQENSSTRSWESLSSLVKEKEAAGWEILFMGAGIDAYKQGGMMGISASKTVSYGTDEASTNNLFRDTAIKTAMFSRGVATSMAYSTEEKRRAGDWS